MTQYATDANLAARQRLWREGKRDRDVDVHGWLIDLAGATSARDVLEVGCGNGAYLVRLPHAAGIDLSPGMLAAARRGGATNALACADAQHLPFGNDTFDVVLAPHMLYHVPDRAAAAHELRRVLRPGGVCVASTNSELAMQQLVGLVEGVVGNGWRWMRSSFVAFSLENGAEQMRTAFDDVETHAAPSSTYPIDDPGLVADYVASLADAHDHGIDWMTWDDVVAECRRRVATAIERDGAFEITPRSGAFVCR